MNTKLVMKNNELQKFSGELFVSGAKNAALPELAASLLTEQTVKLSQVPYIADISSMITVIATLGAEVNITNKSVEISAVSLNKQVAPDAWVKKIRASLLLLGPLLARFGYAKIAMPGGCAIGARPIIEHVNGFRALGAEIKIEGDVLIASAKSLVGAHIKMQSVSVGATENLMMCAVLAEGQTILSNAACEPEVVDLAIMLNKMGAKISGYGTSEIVIDGVKALSGVSHEVMPDRIEAGTLLIAAAAARGRLKLFNCPVSSMSSVIDALLAIGANLDIDGSTVVLDMCGRRPKSHSIKTEVYPGFPTDLQPQWAALSAISEGECYIEENIFDNRLQHIQELKKMGAIVVNNGNTIHINGVELLKGVEVTATDLRAAAALVIAAIAAKGETCISNAFYLDRGYEAFEQKLMQCGMILQRELDGEGDKVVI